MSQPPLMLGGVPIVLHAGAPDLTEEPIGGETLLRMSDGAGVAMTHWQKMAGSISGQGWMPPGLDGLDFSQPLELRSTQVNSMQGTGLVYTLPGTPRPDLAPWAFALIGKQWLETPCATVDGVATVTAMAGAEAYQVWWRPVYSVKAARPQKRQGTGQGWSFSWEEL